jgi:hypothetical protein
MKPTIDIRRWRKIIEGNAFPHVPTRGFFCISRRGREIHHPQRLIQAAEGAFQWLVWQRTTHTNDVYTCDLADETPTERMDHNTSVLTPAPLLLHLFPETTHQFMVGFLFSHWHVWTMSGLFHYSRRPIHFSDLSVLFLFL